MEARVNELLPLATKIAQEFDNIPGLPHAEIELAAPDAAAIPGALPEGDLSGLSPEAMRQLILAVLKKPSPPSPITPCSANSAVAAAGPSITPPRNPAAIRRR